MSRKLPARPNLEHLRNQAKDLLADLRRRDPGLQLADAQRRLAREYGFAGWPELKAHAARTLAGTWEADASCSTPHPLNPFRSATLHLAIDGAVVRIDDEVIDETGRSERNSNTLYVDGKPRRVAHGFTVVAQWRGGRAIDAIVTKDDRVEGRVSYEHAAATDTLTVRTDQSIAVFRRRDTR